MAGDVDKTTSDDGGGAPLRQRLLDVAIDEFAEFGYSGARTASITLRAGCSETAMFKYYRNKRALFLACLEHAEAEVDRDVERHLAPATSDPWVIWREFLGHPGIIRRYHRLTAMRMLASGLRGEPELQAHLEQGTERLIVRIAGTIEHGKAVGTVDPAVDARNVAWVWLGLALAGCYRAGIIGDRTVFDSTLAEGAALLFDVLRSGTEPLGA